MKSFDAEVTDVEATIYLYGDPEFAAFMWEEIEEDVETEDSEDVVRLHFIKSDKFEIEWLGMELVDNQVINHVEITRPFGKFSIDPTKIKYRGWIPTACLKLQNGNQNGLRIFKKI